MCFPRCTYISSSVLSPIVIRHLKWFYFKNINTIINGRVVLSLPCIMFVKLTIYNFITIFLDYKEEVWWRNTQERSKNYHAVRSESDGPAIHLGEGWSSRFLCNKQATGHQITDVSARVYSQIVSTRNAKLIRNFKY